MTLLEHLVCERENADCNKALARIYPLIQEHYVEIEDFINSVEEISDVRKKFYIVMLRNRFEKILEPAYKTLENKKCIYAGKRS